MFGNRTLLKVKPFTFRPGQALKAPRDWGT